MQHTTSHALIDRYQAFLLDAYGVLVDGGGALPHAAEFVAALRNAGKAVRLVSNDASRTPAQISARLHALGITLHVDEVVSSGMMIAPWVRQHGLQGAPAVVLGPAGSHELAARAGLHMVQPGDPAAHAVVVCDDAGYDFLPTLEATLTALVARLSAGQPCALALPNPDVVYPKPGGALGLTAGAAATVLERALVARLGDHAPRFEPLGKPYAPIFASAVQSLEVARRQTVMLGDQLETDVAGASNFGLDVVLVETGISRRPSEDAKLQPTWVLRSL